MTQGEQNSLLSDYIGVEDCLSAFRPRPVYRALVFGLALCFGESIDLT
jgi:hypothetical protein